VIDLYIVHDARDDKRIHAETVYLCDVCDESPAQIRRDDLGRPQFVCIQCFEDRRYDR
jgi:predicted SprT family Zn-dependent metalloprotease